MIFFWPRTNDTQDAELGAIGWVKERGDGEDEMKLKVWGARGSVPAPGPEMNRYGGNTSCVELELSDGSTLIIDAGTGIRSLGVGIAQRLPKINILLTHLHLDHIQGLMFFAPCFRSETEITIWGPSSPEASLEERISRYISAPLSPVEVRELPCEVSFRDTPASEWDLGPARIRAESVTHRGPTLGYRITDGPTTLTYISDHEPGLGSAAGEPGTRVDLRLRPRPGRGPADPRLPVHGRGIPRARRLGPLPSHRHSHLRPAGRGAAAADVPSRPPPLRRLPRSLPRRGSGALVGARRPGRRRGDGGRGSGARDRRPSGDQAALLGSERLASDLCWAAAVAAI